MPIFSYNNILLLSYHAFEKSYMRGTCDVNRMVNGESNEMCTEGLA